MVLRGSRLNFHGKIITYFVIMIGEREVLCAQLKAANTPNHKLYSQILEKRFFYAFYMSRRDNLNSANMCLIVTMRVLGIEYGYDINIDFIV